MRAGLLSFVSIVVASAFLLIATPRGRANGWPTPAAGSSRSGDPEVVFTFDDGPHERYTEVVLDTLAAHHVQAIFFCVGDRVTDESPAADRRRAMLAREIADGHIIANHTSTHVQLCAGSEERTAQEIDDNRARYAALAHMPIGLFRAPYGSRCARLERMLDERMLRHLHWDIDPQEWRTGSAKRTVDYVTRRLQHLEGRAVVLMHDVKRATAEALPQILDWIDHENATRVASGRRPIRIVPASQVVEEELMAPGLSQFLAETAAAVGTGALDVLDALVP